MYIIGFVLWFGLVDIGFELFWEFIYKFRCILSMSVFESVVFKVCILFYFILKLVLKCRESVV